MRLTDKEKAAIVHEFAAGKGVREIARKFQVTHTTVSKILRSNKVSKVESGNLPQESASTKKTRAEYRKEIIEKAYISLYGKTYDKLSAETLLKIIERLSYIESITADEITPKEELAEIVAQIEKVTNGTDGKAD